MKPGKGIVGRHVIYRGAEGVVEFVQGAHLSIKFARSSVWPIHKRDVKFVRGEYREERRVRLIKELVEEKGAETVAQLRRRVRADRGQPGRDLSRGHRLSHPGLSPEREGEGGQVNGTRY